MDQLRETEELRARIALAGASGVGPLRTGALLRRFRSAGNVLRATDRALRSVENIGHSTIKELRAAAECPALSDEHDCALAQGYSLISVVDGTYPDLLAQIYDPPALIWVDGLSAKLSNPCIAIVGTRRATAAGKSTAYALAYEFVVRGFTIVSGLAYGIDRMAHEGALDAGGNTIAVLGSGLNNVYPRLHRRLAERTAKQGAVISEFPLKAEPDPGHFPRRNRIVSGLSLATIIVEAHERGGALITARLALDQNREVYAVPGPIGSSASEGTNRLIQNGAAQLLMSVDDVVRDLRFAPEKDDEIGSVDGLTALGAEDGEILDHLSVQPRHVDDLSETLSLDISVLLVRLIHLECAGLIRQLPGKYYVSLQSGERDRKSMSPALAELCKSTQKK